MYLYVYDYKHPFLYNVHRWFWNVSFMWIIKFDWFYDIFLMDIGINIANEILTYFKSKNITSLNSDIWKFQNKFSNRLSAFAKIVLKFLTLNLLSLWVILSKLSLWRDEPVGGRDWLNEKIPKARYKLSNFLFSLK